MAAHPSLKMNQGSLLPGRSVALFYCCPRISFVLLFPIFLLEHARVLFNPRVGETCYRDAIVTAPPARCSGGAGGRRSPPRSPPASPSFPSGPSALLCWQRPPPVLHCRVPGRAPPCIPQMLSRAWWTGKKEATWAPIRPTLRPGDCHFPTDFPNVEEREKKRFYCHFHCPAPLPPSWRLHW